MLGTATTAAATLKTATQSIRLKTASLRTSAGSAACQVFSSRDRATPVQPTVSRQLGNGRQRLDGGTRGLPGFETCQIEFTQGSSFHQPSVCGGKAAVASKTWRQPVAGGGRNLKNGETTNTRGPRRRGWF